MLRPAGAQSCHALPFEFADVRSTRPVNLAADRKQRLRRHRQLRFAVAAQRVSPSTANKTWRDKVIDICLQTPSWNGTYGLHMLSETSTTGAGFDWNAGDRVQVTFHMGIWMDAYWHAWKELDAEDDSRLAAWRGQLLAMATHFRDCGFDTDGFINQFTGRNISSQTFLHGGSTGAPAGVYTVAPINGLVFAYKLTGDQTYLDRAWLLWETWQFSLGGANTIQHYTDSQIGADAGDILANNKGELQYCYALFEKGGSPSVV